MRPVRLTSATTPRALFRVFPGRKALVVASASVSVAPSQRRAPFWLMPIVVLAVALGSAVCLYGHFLDAHRHLWDAAYHDRSAHYLYSLKLATHAREGRLF